MSCSPPRGVSGCPWVLSSPAPSAPPPSLLDVMSEQLAVQMHEDQHKTQEQHHSHDNQQPFMVSTSDCDDDLLIAQMLQLQFDQEFDLGLDKQEKHANRDSKVTVSYHKYKVMPDHRIWHDSSEEEDDLDDSKRPLDCYETAERELGALPKCGYRKSGDQIVTKHDKEISQRANGRRIMEFPPGIQTGDGGGFDMQLSNTVYNDIRNFSFKEGKRRHRIHDKEEKSTATEAVDKQTRILLFKMVNNNVLDRINGVISTGKEAVIMHAEGGSNDDHENQLNIPPECAIKVFKTTLNEFKTRDKYIKEDYRFKDRFGKQNPRKIVHVWAEKELHNLTKMHRFGMRVPEPVLLKKHVLVMQFIGKEGQPAPKLKDAILSQSDKESAYQQIVAMMKKLYVECKLIHADLSEYNILWHEKECWMIDVSQSVTPNHPHGLEFLYRDCSNIVDFFSKNGVDCMSSRDLFTEISDLALDSECETETAILTQLRNYEKNGEILSGLADSENTYPFDYCWEKSKTSPMQPIPGPARSKRICGKSPKQSFSKSPVSSWTKSPKSPSSYLSLTDEELKKMKESLVKADDQTPDATTEPRKPTLVKFQDEEQE